MADTRIKNVGPDISQLSSKLSFIEGRQVSAIRNTGSLNPTAGQIKSDVTGALNNNTAQQRSAMDIGANIASKLESVGVHTNTTTKLIDSAVVSTVVEKTPLPQIFPKLPVDLSNVSNRIPNSKNKRPTEVMKETRESLVGVGDLMYAGMSYPSDLQSEAPAYVRLMFHKYKRPNPFSAGSINPVYFIEFPLPDNLSLNFSAKYNERDTGMMGQLMQTEAASKAAAAASSAAGGPAERLAAALKSGGGSLLNTTQDDALRSIKEVAERSLFTELATAEETVGGLAEQFAGAIPNPHPTVFFKGMDLRTFQWTWKFVPRSQQEAADLQAALKIIRKYVLPAKEAGFLQYPHLIEPSIEGENTLMYGTFKKAVVRQFSINFTGEGASAFYIDGNPVSVICSMEFQEIENFTSEDA